AVQARVVGRGLQQEKLFLPRVPVRADALEAAGAVVKRVGHRADVYVVVAQEFALEEDPGVRMHGARLRAQLEIGLDAHPGRDSNEAPPQTVEHSAQPGNTGSLGRARAKSGSLCDPSGGRAWVAKTGRQG